MKHRETLYDSFNARNVPPKEVAKTFIVNDEFRCLIKNDPVILMGPRGSGKTTLLKMLTLEALHSWSAPEAKEILTTIPFRAVYIPADVHWKRQLAHMEKELTQLPKFARRVSESAVTLNVLKSLLDAFEDRIRYESAGDREAEAALCAALADCWFLKPRIPDFSSLRTAIDQMVNELGAQINEAIDRYRDDKDVPTLARCLYLDYFAATRVACSAFQEAVKPPHLLRWGLCFDELELAPAWLQVRLFAELRSTDERFLFRLSTSPVPAIAAATLQAQQRQDYQVEFLWSHGRRNTRDFCERLATATLKRKLGRAVSPVEVFGISQIYNRPRQDQEATEYSPGSPAYSAIMEVAKWDKGLKSILRKHDISPNDPTTNDVQKRDQVLRKMKPLVFHRLLLRKADGGRSRKVLPAYYGVEAVYEVCDANPRWLIGIIEDMLEALPAIKEGKWPSARKTTSVSEQIRFTKQLQNRVLTDASKQFLALLRSLADAEVVLDRGSKHLSQVLKTIGDYFFDRIVNDRFTLDPVGSFFIDAGTDRRLWNLLRLAAYQGAIVEVDPQATSVTDNMLRRRFRISYMLAPAFRLPLRLYSAVPFSRCIERDAVLGLSRTARSPEARRAMIAQQQFWFDTHHEDPKH